MYADYQSASEMIYIVSGGALNSTHSLTADYQLCCQMYIPGQATTHMPLSQISTIWFW